MLAFLLRLFRLVWLFLRGHQALVLENLALRQQLSVYKRKQKRPRLTRWDRLFWIALAGSWRGWRKVPVRRSPGHGGALAEAAFQKVLGSIVETWEEVRSTADWQAHPRADPDYGSGEWALACAPDPRRVAQAWNRGLRADRFPHPANH